MKTKHSGEELVEIHKIREERIEGAKNKLALVKKLNTFITAKNKHKSKESLLKTKDKIYNSIKEFDEIIDLIKFILVI